MPSPSAYGDLFSPEGIQVRFSASSLKDWQKCPRYYYYTWVEGYRGKSESVHLRFGDLFARALQLFYTLRAKDTPWDEARREVVRWLHAETEDWDPEAAGLSKAELKNRHTLLRTVVWYLDEYETYDFPIWHLADGSPALELKFEFDIDHGAAFVGTLDRVVENGDELLIMDQKTTGSTIGGYWFETFDLDTQMSLYTLAGRTCYSSEIRGVMLDGVQVAKGFTQFARQPTYRSDEQLSEWLVETQAHIEQIQQANRYWQHRAADAQVEGIYPRNLMGCTLYGRCAFFDICRRPPGLRKNFLAVNFEKPKDDA